MENSKDVSVPCFAQVPAAAIPTVVEPSVRIRNGKMTIEISNDVSESVLSFLKEVLVQC